MKILFFLCLSFSLSAKVVETEKTFSIDFSSTSEAKKLYSQLNVPIDFGTFNTGKKHSYKLFQDVDKNFSLYCTQVKYNDFQCIYTINKIINGNEVILDNNDVEIHLSMTNKEQSKKLFDALDVKTISHSEYLMKVLTDDQSLFGVSCLVDVNSFSNYQCDIRIFK